MEQLISWEIQGIDITPSILTPFEVDKIEGISYEINYTDENKNR